MNNAIDLAFLTAKVATLKDEKAKMIVEGASLAYNITQVARFRSMIVELSQICNYIVYKARITGGCTQGEYDLALECQRQIEECNTLASTADRASVRQPGCRHLLGDVHPSRIFKCRRQISTKQAAGIREAPKIQITPKSKINTSQSAPPPILHYILLYMNRLR